MSMLPSVGGCCETCEEQPSVQVPGPQGDPGADGTNGTDGINAFTTCDSFTMPAEGANVTVTCGNSDWCDAGEIVYATGGAAKGWFEVQSKPNSTSVILKNVENTASSEYSPNSPPGTVFPNASTLQPSGLQGPEGPAADPSLFFQIANNLSEGTAATMRSNLGLGSIAMFDQGVSNGQVPNIDDAGGIGNDEVVWGNGIAIEGRTPAQTRTGLGLGTAALLDSGVANGNLPPVDTTFDAGDVLFATAGGVQTKTADQARTALGVIGGYGLLGSLINQSTALTGDFQITPPVSKYRIDKITFSNPNFALGSAQFAAYTGAGGTGTTIALPQSIAGLSAITSFIDLVLEAICGTDYFAGSFQIRCTTAQALGTCDVHVFGWDLS
jgi:hypothetical protein